MSRKPIIAGNWKMNMLQSEAEAFITELKGNLESYSKEQMLTVVIAPPFTAINSLLPSMCQCGCGCSKFAVAGQNCHWESKGAYTGEVSVEMLADAGCEYVIIGHSERRQYFSETDEMINKKAKAILAGGLIPIICCGETLEQREAGVTDEHIASQIRAALSGLTEDQISGSVIAYEPIWAIGTGKTCDADEANRVIAGIRAVVASVSSQSAADSIRILYGGSVNPGSISEQMSKSDIDGALIGGASLSASSLNEIIANTMKVMV